MDIERFEIPGLVERPDWWLVRPDEIISFCRNIKKGKVSIEAVTPMGFPVFRVVYNEIEHKNQVNWISAVGTKNPEIFNDSDMQTVMISGGIHGCEIEGTVLVMNLISLLETGRDLRGKENPEIVELAKKYSLVLFPCVNMDGRAISPDHRMNADVDFCRRSGGGWWKDNRTIVWPEMKEYFPLPLEEVGYRGGYPNSEGYNIQLDASPGGIRTEEAKAILKAADEKRIDLFLNLHSQPGSPNVFITQPSVSGYPSQTKITFELAHACMSAWKKLGYKYAPDTELSTNARADINSAVQLCSGAAVATVEYPAKDAGSFDRILETGYVLLDVVFKYGKEHKFCDRKNWLTNNK